VAWWRATSSQIVAWIGSSPSLMKFVFFNQASDIVLSVIDRARLPSLSMPMSMSTQGVIIAAKCSNRLFDARNLRSFGR
jgi:hypothetical protein